jgi:hypothetical protein
LDSFIRARNTIAAQQAFRYDQGFVTDVGKTWRPTGTGSLKFPSASSVPMTDQNPIITVAPARTSGILSVTVP